MDWAIIRFKENKTAVGIFLKAFIHNNHKVIPIA